MEISIEEINKELREEILIRCHEVDDEIYEIVNKLKTDNLIVLGYQNDKVHRIKLSDIYYFEAVDGKVFCYCKDNVFEVKQKQKLYELEDLCKGKNCISASIIIMITSAKMHYPGMCLDLKSIYTIIAFSFISA